MVQNVVHGSMLQEYYGGAMAAIVHERKRLLHKVNSRAKALAYRDRVRKLLSAAFAFPHRTPLDAEITGSFRANGALVDKVIFESRPGFKITALFLRP